MCPSKIAIRGLDDENSTQKRCVKRHQSPCFCYETGQNGEIWAKLRHFSRIARPKEGILKVARPAQTSPNGQIPVQNGRMAGL